MQIFGEDDTNIGGNHVSGGESHHVTWNQLRDGNFHVLSAADHSSV